MTRSTTLPSGLRVITEQMSHVRSATLGIWADVGSAAEQPQQRGISHLVEHMLFKGTANRTAREIAEAMDAVGGNLNAFTDKEATCYYAKVIDAHVPLALDILADMFLNSRFAPDDLEREKNVVLEEIKMYDDSPDEVLADLFVRTMWSGSNLGDPTIGYASTVSAITTDDVRRHLEERYTTDTVLITAAGNVDHDVFVAQVAEAFATFTRRGGRPAPERPRLTPQTVIQPHDCEQAYVLLGTHGLSQRDDRRFALAVLDTVLGGGMSSRLFQEIRESRGLAYSVYSFQAAYRDAGMFAVSFGTAPENVQECVDLIGAEFESLVAGGVTDAEFNLAKEHIKGSLPLSLETTESRMLRLGRDELVLGRRQTLEEIEAKVEAVTIEDVAEIAQTLLGGREWGLCVLGPVDPGTIRWNVRAAA